MSKEYPCIAGMLLIKAGSLEEAKAFCMAEPMGDEGYVVHPMSTLWVANKENNYLL